VTATARFGLDPAPPELRLTQELLNTTGTRGGHEDLLDSAYLAREWFAAIHPDRLRLGVVDVLDLVELRTILRRLVRGEPVELVGSVDIRVDAEQAVAVPRVGETRWAHSDGFEADGAGWLRSAILAECLLGRALGTWSRLKLCHNRGCQVAFYDCSRNGSRIWHDVSTCGNVANVRAHRERNRTFG
jgi:predicted RNA-binding Zn ribbon-like protein